MVIAPWASASASAASAEEEEEEAAAMERETGSSKSKKKKKKKKKRERRQKQVLFVSLGVEGHLEPLVRLAEHLHARGGYGVQIASHEEGRGAVERRLPASAFVSLGPLPVSRERLGQRLWSLSREGGKVSALIKDVYVDLWQGMHSALWDLFLVGGAGGAADGVGEDGEWGPEDGESTTTTMKTAKRAVAECESSPQDKIHDKEDFGGSADVDSSQASPSTCSEVSGVVPRKSEGAALAPDLIVVDIASLPGLDLAHRLGVSCVINSPTLLPDFVELPGAYSGSKRGGDQDSFWQRCLDVATTRLNSLVMAPVFFELNHKRIELGLEPFSSLGSIFRNSRVLVNAHPHMSLRHPQAPTSPLVLYTGPLFPLGYDYHLKKNESYVSYPWSTQSFSSLDTWLADIAGGRSGSGPNDGAKRAAGGIERGSKSECQRQDLIYVNFGQLGVIYEDQASSLATGLAQAAEGSPQVVWFVSSKNETSGTDTHVVESAGIFSRLVDPSIKLPENVLISRDEGRELPHLEILAHPCTRAVVSHCGAAAAQEAIAMGLPLLCIPALGDQFQVANFLSHRGAGIVLPWQYLNSSSVSHSIERLLTDPSFVTRAGEVGAEVLSMRGSMRAVDSIISHLELGNEHMDPLYYAYPWYQESGADLAAFFFAIVIMGALMTHCIISAVLFGYRILTRSPSQGQGQEEAHAIEKDEMNMRKKCDFVGASEQKSDPSAAKHAD